jgi:two-component system sensor histidine kinase HydH
MDRESTQERIRTRQLARLGALFAGFAHEIRNPLSTIGLNLGLIREEFREPETPREKRVHKRLGVVEEQVQRLQGVLDEFLTYVRVPELQLRSVDLHGMLSNLVEFEMPAAANRGVSLRLFEGNHVPPVRLDPSLFRAVLENLVRNALEVCAEGDQILLGVRERGDEVEITVTDTGPGMSRETQEKLFTPFFSTKKSGHGLGLATARRIVEQHGGRIAVESDLGQGTQFTIRLPGDGAARGEGEPKAEGGDA